MAKRKNTRKASAPNRRPAIPRDIQTEVLTLSRRRCCICFSLDKNDTLKRGQIAHLDNNRTNNEIDNLAFLCLAHHDEYDSQTSQSKGLSLDEVKRYRTELMSHLAVQNPPADDVIVAQLAAAFDRPAFRTPFQQESSMPRFRDAITETIATLNTGKTPQGLQISSKMQIRNTSLRGKVDLLVQALVALRGHFDDLHRKGDVHQCKCGNPDCTIWFMSPKAIDTMNTQREHLFRLVQDINPKMAISFYDMQ